MSEDRPVEDYGAAIAAMRETYEDRLSTIEARQYQRPTGDIEIAFRGTPKPGTLFLQGQTLQRADYPALWAWAQTSGSVVAGGYGAGNGTTTFTVPDMRDRVIVGAGGTVALGATGGAATRTLTVANLPAHDHNVATGSAGAHGHGGSTGASGGNHGAHNEKNYSVRVGIPGEQYGLFAAESSFGNTSHTHSLDLDDAPGHTHPVTEAAVGSGTAFDNRPPYLGVNVAVWV